MPALRWGWKSEIVLQLLLLLLLLRRPGRAFACWPIRYPPSPYGNRSQLTALVSFSCVSSCGRIGRFSCGFYFFIFPVRAILTGTVSEEVACAGSAGGSVGLPQRDPDVARKRSGVPVSSDRSCVRGTFVFLFRHFHCTARASQIVSPAHLFAGGLPRQHPGEGSSDQFWPERATACL